MTKYPEANYIQWRYDASNPSYYKGINKPEIIVIHIQQGYATTSVSWANSGYTSASWHFTVTKTGGVYQFLEENDGGYHAGISRLRDNGVSNPEPTFKLWKGWGRNVNTYSFGIEHEGFSGQIFSDAQIEASAKLSAWLCKTFNIKPDRDHIIGHYEITLIDRADDPGPSFPWEKYIKLVNKYYDGDDDMTEDQKKQLEIAYRLANKLLQNGYGTEAELDRLLKIEASNLEDRINNLETKESAESLRNRIEKVATELKDHKASHNSGSTNSTDVPPHTHEASIKLI